MVKARKIAIVGSRSVGKSSMTVKYIEDHFVESYYPTIENNFSKSITVNNQQYALEVLDTAGQDEFSIMNEKHIIGIHGYLLVYSVTLWQSFELIEIIRDKILDSIGSDSVPIVLVGNKSDLDYSRQVEFSDGEKLAKTFGCKFFETSVKDSVNVGKVFEEIVEEIERVQNPEVKVEEKCVIV